jgi:hypothetical protein
VKKPKPANILLFTNEGMEFRREGFGREWSTAKPTLETFDGDLQKCQTGMRSFAIVSDNLE